MIKNHEKLTDNRKKNWKPITLLYSLVRTLKPKVIVEIGIGRHGFTTEVILKACQDNNIGHLWSIDCDRKTCEPVIRRLVKTEWGYWTPVIMDAIIFAENFKQKIDLFLIDDGDLRSDEYFLKTMHTYLPLMEKNGIIIIYNTIIFRHLRERCIAFFMNNKDWELIFLTANSGGRHIGEVYDYGVALVIRRKI